jgi:hypothetical protein
MIPWKEPEIEEVRTNAEIGGYLPDEEPANEPPDASLTEVPRAEQGRGH